jgi:hypothetical protein
MWGLLGCTFSPVENSSSTHQSEKHLHIVLEFARFHIFFGHDTNDELDNIFCVDVDWINFVCLISEVYNHLVGLSQALGFGWCYHGKQSLVMLRENENSRHDSIVGQELKFLIVIAGFQPGIDRMFNTRDLLADHHVLRGSVWNDDGRWDRVVKGDLFGLCRLI